MGMLEEGRRQGGCIEAQGGRRSRACSAAHRPTGLQREEGKPVAARRLPSNRPHDELVHGAAGQEARAERQGAAAVAARRAGCGWPARPAHAARWSAWAAPDEGALTEGLVHCDAHRVAASQVPTPGGWGWGWGQPDQARWAESQKASGAWFMGPTSTVCSGVAKRCRAWAVLIGGAGALGDGQCKCPGRVAVGAGSPAPKGGQAARLGPGRPEERLQAQAQPGEGHCFQQAQLEACSQV